MSARLESYAHQGAKRLLLEWLRASAKKAGLDRNAALGDIGWRVNRRGPHFGVWEEYPVLADGTGISPVWDEVDRRWRRRPPRYDEVVASGVRPMAIIDIAIQHKGCIAFAIEVVHKHHCEPRKIGFLKDKLTLVEVPAYWALGQVARPATIPAEFFIV